MTANRPEGHDRLGPPLRTPPARNSGHGLVQHAIDFAPPAGVAWLRIPENIACIWSIVSDGSGIQLNGNC